MYFTDEDILEMKTIRNHYDWSKPNDTEKMFTFLRGFCSDKYNPKPETMRALCYARRKHQNQTRKNGDAYIVHPLSMACFAIGLGMTDDNLIAVILLHDICEDTDTNVKDLPVNDTVKHGVKYMTIKEIPGEEKMETKRRYFWSLLEDKNALLCKAIDRYSNLSTMVGVFDIERIKRNIIETDDFLMPVLKEAKEVYPELSNELYILRNILRNFYGNLAIVFGLDIYRKKISDEKIEELVNNYKEKIDTSTSETPV